MASRRPGQEILALLQGEADSLRAEAVAKAEVRDAAVARLNQLNETRETVLTRLAELSLPNLDRNSIESTHAGVRQRLRELADRRSRREEELDARKRRLDEQLADKQRAIDEAQATTTATATRLAERRKQLEEFLAADAGYVQMQAGCEEARARLERDQHRLAEVEADAEEKLPAYETSTLFQYLLKRNYGTNEAIGWAMTRALDRRLARLIDYPSLRESYRFLTTVPELMQEELQKREAEVDDLVEQMMDAIKQAEHQFELPVFESDYKTATAELGRRETDRDRAAAQVDAVAKDLAEVRSNENRFYADALNELKRFLEAVETDALERHAARTDEVDDDDAVAELRACRLDADTLAAEVSSATADSQQSADLADGLDFVLRRARQTDLGSERAHFAKSFDVSEPLRQFTKGVIDRNRFLAVLKDECELDPTWAEKAYEKGSEIANSQAAQILIGTAASAAQPLIREALRRRMR